MPVLKADSLQSTVYSIPKKILLSLFTLLLVTTVSGQKSVVISATPLEQAKQDYAFQIIKYNETHKKYAAAKNNYMAFKTAAAKNEAFIQTQQYIVQVHNVYKTYLLVINERSNLYDWGTSGFSKDEEHKLIQEEIKNLEDLRNEATKLTTLEETVAHAQKLKDQASKKTFPTAYKLLARTDYAQLTELEYLFGQNAQKIDEFATENIPENDSALLLNWQTAISNTKAAIRKDMDAKKIEISALAPNLVFNSDNVTFDFKTMSQRSLFTPTVGLLKEILNLL